MDLMALVGGGDKINNPNSQSFKRWAQSKLKDGWGGREKQS